MTRMSARILQAAADVREADRKEYRFEMDALHRDKRAKDEGYIPPGGAYPMGWRAADLFSIQYNGSPIDYRPGRE